MMKSLVSDILNALLPALLLIAGFAAGGALVLVVLAVQPGSRGVDMELLPIRDSADAEMHEDPRPRDAVPELTVRPLPPASGDTLRRPGAVDAIDDDSLAILVEVLRERDLEMPVEDVDADELRDDFDDPRSEGRAHEALDIPASRGTPVVAVEDGTIAGLDPSQGGGGNVVYQFDPSGEFVYYYAHLDSFTDGLAVGQAVKRGDVVGFVGTSGNAPPGVPHLHFAITKTSAPFRRYGGTPINPFDVLR